ncbi:MAG: hypothetical protein H8E36_01990 [Rhodospirillaceae bacterium]|nr:hypothetical protein [Rhodospirillaceae bacterium]MBL6940900.1 hypothetical protein [Rhodospirillales bacterium]
MDTPDDENIPPGIGPHEGKELELMLAGEKPVAMFSDVIPPSFELPEQDFAPYVADGKLIMRDIVVTASQTGSHDMRFLFYALPEEQWRIERLIEIHRAIHQHDEPSTHELETEIGQLLGYKDQDIQIFLDRSLKSSSG